jgi:LacI family transcriptional regulator
MSNVTLKKIAEELGISVSTVSRALKDYHDISDATKEKVNKLVQKLNYHPNSFAQSLRTKESKIIGLIIPEIVHHFFANIIKGVLNAAKEVGYLVIVLQSDESYENEKKQVELLLERNVDGILLSLSDKTIYFDHIQNLIDEEIPVVLYDKISKSIHCSKVAIDDRKAAFDATEYLIQSGCKKIAHIHGPLKPQTTIDRLMGYRNAIKKHGISYDKSLVYVSEDLSFENGYDLAKQILQDHPDVDGVFCFTDLVAVGVLTGLNDLEIQIPEQVSVVGFSNWFMTQITSPKLTTVNQPGYQMGVEAFGLLFEQFTAKKNSQKIAPRKVVVPTELIVRDSTK